MAEVNPIIPNGQLGYDRLNNRMSMGDGETEWAKLPRIGVPYPPADGKVYVMVNNKWAALDWDDITVTIPPDITSATDLVVALGETLNYVITASDADDATFTATGLPDGATYDANTHTVTWDVPVDADYSQLYTFVATVANTAGTATKRVNISIEVPESFLPKITPNQIITAAVGQEMSPYQILGTNITVTEVNG